MFDQYKYKTGLRRVGAAIVDNIVFWPLTVVADFIGDSYETTSLAYNHFLVVAPVAYSIICHYRFGMTIGKKVAGIKVIDVSENRPITLRQAFLRDIAFVILSIADIAISIWAYSTWELGETPEYILTALTLSGSAWLLWTITEIVSMLTNSKRRAIHDFIAGTVVVRIDEYERSRLINEHFPEGHRNV